MSEFMRRTITTWVLGLMVAVAIVFSTTSAMADDKQEAVSIEVRMIAAGIDEDSFDSELKDLRSRLQRGFRDYTSFEQLDRQTRPIEVNDERDFELPTEDTLTVGYLGRDGELKRLRLALGERLDTSLRVAPGSTFFQAGLRYDRRLLILSITVD